MAFKIGPVAVAIALRRLRAMDNDEVRGVLDIIVLALRERFTDWERDEFERSYDKP